MPSSLVVHEEIYSAPTSSILVFYYHSFLFFCTSFIFFLILPIITFCIHQQLLFIACIQIPLFIFFEDYISTYNNFLGNGIIQSVPFALITHTKKHTSNTFVFKLCSFFSFGIWICSAHSNTLKCSIKGFQHFMPPLGLFL